MEMIDTILSPRQSSVEMLSSDLYVPSEGLALG